MVNTAPAPTFLSAFRLAEAPSDREERDTIVDVAPSQACEEATMGRGILLWLLGVPIPVIIVLWLLFGH
ncbi:hypothetical protein BSN85_19405 [Bradyrhizobium brasilense]|nr:hypothetical protein BSN85_19405 [Bradyrhizobium brasilense]